jgi:hypothetical protein
VNHRGLQKNIPIIRIGNLAAMPEERIFTEKLGWIDAYLVEARSIGGLSGSPVFVHPAGIKQRPGKTALTAEGKFYWLGMMHGHWDIDMEGSFEELTKLEAVNMGVAIVVPVSKILEVFDHPDLVRRKRETEQKMLGASSPTMDEAVDQFGRQDFLQSLSKVSRKSAEPDEEMS